MKEAFGDILKTPGDAYVVTTNGFVKANGECVMGRGIAKQIANLFPSIPKLLGTAILAKGNHVHVFPIHGIYIISFPVKPIKGISDGTNTVSRKDFPAGSIVPGWAMKADPEIIIRSAKELVEVADKHGFTQVVCPRFGCGAGELKWEYIQPLVANILDDRFTTYTFKE